MEIKAKKKKREQERQKKIEMFKKDLLEHFEISNIPNAKEVSDFVWTKGGGHFTVAFDEMSEIAYLFQPYNNL